MQSDNIVWGESSQHESMNDWRAIVFMSWDKSLLTKAANLWGQPMKEQDDRGWDKLARRSNPSKIIILSEQNHHDERTTPITTAISLPPPKVALCRGQEFALL